jgi:hypothetical protein
MVALAIRSSSPCCPVMLHLLVLVTVTCTVRAGRCFDAGNNLIYGDDDCGNRRLNCAGADVMGLTGSDRESAGCAGNRFGHRELGDSCNSHSNCGSKQGGQYPCLCRATGCTTNLFCADGSCDDGCCSEKSAMRTTKQNETCDASRAAGWFFFIAAAACIMIPLGGIFWCMSNKKNTGHGDPLPQAWMICVLLFCFTGPCFMWIP